jgi:hypothetical protein
MGLVLKWPTAVRVSKSNFGFHRWQDLAWKIEACQRKSCRNVRFCADLGGMRAIALTQIVQIRLAMRAGPEPGSWNSI